MLAIPKKPLEGVSTAEECDEQVGTTEMQLLHYSFCAYPAMHLKWRLIYGYLVSNQGVLWDICK